MKLQMVMMTMVGASALGSMSLTAQAQQSTATAIEPPNMPPMPATAVPTTTPDIDAPVSPAAPVVPGEMPPMVTPMALPPPAPPVHAERSGSGRGLPAWMAPIGAAVMLGGGYEDFTYSNVKEMTGGGGSWDARLVAGTRRFIGLEAAYVGAARSIQTLGLAQNTSLVSNGVEGALRVNVPLVQGMSLIEPFGFIGLGWQHYSLTNAASNTSDLTGSDDVMSMPYGGGIEASVGAVLIDARFTYRQTYMNDLLRATGGKLNTWGVGGNLGVAF
jgi:hypothetical protein